MGVTRPKRQRSITATPSVPLAMSHIPERHAALAGTATRWKQRQHQPGTRVARPAMNLTLRAPYRRLAVARNAILLKRARAITPSSAALARTVTCLMVLPRKSCHQAAPPATRQQTFRASTASRSTRNVGVVIRPTTLERLCRGRTASNVIRTWKRTSLRLGPVSVVTSSLN